MRIRVTRFYGQVPELPMVGEFGPEGGTIGRDVGCTLVLPDPFKRVSRLHAEIRREGGFWVLTDRGSKLPVSVGDQEVGQDMECDLEDGDVLTIGRIEMIVEIGEPSWASPPPAPPTPPKRPDDDPPIGAGMKAILDALREEVGKAGGQVGAVLGAAGGDGKPSVQKTPGEPSGDGGSQAAPGGEARTLLDAFVAGLGCRPDGMPHALDARYMRQLGETVAAFASGLLYLMLARAEMKTELGAPTTSVSETGNNPLKFVFAPEHALKWLLEAQTPHGYLPPPVAVAEGFHDLMAHQLGFVAGTRAAVSELVDAFSPDGIERRLASRGLLEKVLPMHRRARLWELYVEHHHELGRDAQEDFGRRFGEVMLRAYQTEVDAVRRTPR